MDSRGEIRNSRMRRQGYKTSQIPKFKLSWQGLLWLRDAAVARGFRQKGNSAGYGAGMVEPLPNHMSDPGDLVGFEELGMVWFHFRTSAIFSKDRLCGTNPLGPFTARLIKAKQGLHPDFRGCLTKHFKSIYNYKNINQ